MNLWGHKDDETAATDAGQMGNQTTQPTGDMGGTNPAENTDTMPQGTSDMGQTQGTQMPNETPDMPPTTEETPPTTTEESPTQPTGGTESAGGMGATPPATNEDDEKTGTV